MPEQLTPERLGAQVAPGALAPGGAPAAGARPRRRSTGQRLAPYLLLGLPVLLVCLALGYPMVRQVVMSFQEFGLAQQFGRPPEFVGLRNYADVVTDPYFWVVVGRSIAFCAVSAAVTMLFGVGFAVLMQHVSRLPRILLQSALVLAWAMPPIAALTVYTWLVEPRYGFVNWLLTSLGLQSFDGYAWLAASAWTFFLVASVTVIWTSVPLVTLSTYAALTQVDEEVVEAAQLDGAGGFQRLRHVVLPIVRPVVLLLLMLQIIWDMKVFTQIKVLQAGAGNNERTNLLGTYVYETGIGGGDYGMASALATVMLVLVLLMTWRYLRTLMKQGDL
ncbi:sugar ABC transporter permease [Paenibacillus sp. TRM 82003]|uniref:carbohydrate ABC transporter permease n=1 Tax=Kineococcus sp. TRM81007 TaxID=2925831 RepID=UPI001F5A3A70|nr:sugar ABC transporter permease [Kineococcus sp. TRM81007]MCI2239414.1 sugar ABC transporter permease [Kineococcus sp. TRM81007]MCI3918784.1 sugar ABC transporter permease [Paenibacillus sp. TRM 82003]